MSVGDRKTLPWMSDAHCIVLFIIPMCRDFYCLLAKNFRSKILTMHFIEKFDIDRHHLRTPVLAILLETISYNSDALILVSSCSFNSVKIW